MRLNHFDAEDFLRNYWQQKPLLIRNAISDFDNPISADELAGLACEAEIESRLIQSSPSDWAVQHGPLDESLFATLPPDHWTLLVQAVDHYIPAVAQLLEYFGFIPNWRIDDVMVSYATKGGSVGPHFDNYDVFLLQGAGSRRWQLGPKYSSQSPLQTDQPLPLLAHFDTEHDWQLSAGDILYIPPRYGHWGTALDNECMTYSIGFRAPSHSELLANFCDHQLTTLTEDLRYTDPGLQLQTNAGEITPQTITTIQQLLARYLNDPEQISRWFGRHMTQPKYPEEHPEPSAVTDPEAWLEDLQQQRPLIRESASRFAYSQLKNQHILYVNGSSFSGHSAACRQLIELLAGQRHYPAQQLLTLIADRESFTLLQQLWQQGWVYFDDQDFH